MTMIQRITSERNLTVFHGVTNRTEKTTSSVLYPDDGGSSFLRNAGTYLSSYIASYPRMLYSKIRSRENYKYFLLKESGITF
jgi:hypothetical protein